jgi:hypothetical protein
MVRKIAHTILKIFPDIVGKDRDHILVGDFKDANILR